MYSAKRKHKTVVLIAYFVIALLMLWAVRHIDNLVTVAGGQHAGLFTMIYAFSFAFLAWQTLLYMLEKPYTATKQQMDRLVRHRIVANVPVCNEDADALKLCLQSMIRQSHRIDVIHVVVNGPNKVDYTDLKRQVLAYAKQHNREIYWGEQAVAGKRQAQKTTVTKYLKPHDFFLTVDSDAYLDKQAVEEGIKPFADPSVQSVAGIVLTMNNRAKFMTRMSDLWFLVSQLVDRSANSTFGAVLVNSGVLAFYRGDLIIDNLEGYTNETFFGRPVEFSDDSLLTIYALQRGKTVQQPTSFAFTLMPEKMSHHFRQQVRWMRGAFIRSMWRFKYLPMDGYAYWSHLIGWFQLLLSTAVFVYLFIYMPAVQRELLPWLLVIPILISYAQGLRYLTVWRSDESFGYRFVTYLLNPIPSLWSFFVLRWVRYYAIATCLKTGWGTRSDVEVTMS
jgi:hyaluronan synthase